VKASIPDIGVEQIDAVLKYLPRLEEEDYRFGEWGVPENHMPYFLFSPEANEFVRALYEEGIVIAFDWQDRWEEAKRYELNREALRTADLLTIRKLLTTHVRKDRFVEGHLASICDQGLLRAILERLKEIRAEMANGASAST